eukprot:CAMPEP_0184347292 /NCGR_PEP_ID=MMETSP1089-20130417/15409_1 /TAXON_ID=38269 ORGANISM="Gloeochaete wittrockiana, Strain SAG46.84" /NCGR_SAMPLE_ID=MMETSP1089 /ASSEMBLY_ACC=CAM_ASM_000445 /LENGTH=377 /DNA_ID=CAMNT_0026678269 /DNA_START=243 /DNA_END=1372 /DNA_ORIENTATION=-
MTGHFRGRFQQAQQRWLCSLKDKGDNNDTGTESRNGDAELMKGRLEINKERLKDLIANRAVQVISDEERGVNFYIVGTSHVSNSCAEQVRRVMRTVVPSSVILELCPSRAERMLLLSPSQANARQVQGLPNFNKAFQNSGFRGVLEASLRSLYKLFEFRGAAVPGQEFVVAAEEAAKIGASIILGDRPIEITMERLTRFVLRVGLPVVVALQLFGVLLDYKLDPGTSVFSEITPGQYLYDWMLNRHLIPALGDTGAMIRTWTVLIDVFVAFLGIPLTVAISILTVSLVPQPVVDFGLKIGRSGIQVPMPAPVVSERDEYIVWTMRNHPYVPKSNADVVVVVGAAHMAGIVRMFNTDIDIHRLIDDPEVEEWQQIETR